MSRYLAQSRAALAPYVPGEQPQDRQYIKLNTNESPFPPAPAVSRAITPEEIARQQLYPDPAASVLENALAAHYGLDGAQVITGNGSDEILSFCFQAYGDAGACFPDITYGFYKVWAQLYGVDAREIPLDADLRVDAGQYVGVGRTIFLANPNAPTGIALTPAQIETVLRGNPDRVVVVDEAYIDFGAQSVVPLTSRYENLLVVMTYSKSWSLAGARIGFALGQAALIADLRRIKFSFHPYNLSRLSQLAGVAALSDAAYMAECIRAVVAARDWTARALTARGFVLTDSQANFVFARHPAVAGRAMYERLRARGILVRHFPAARIDDYVRITIGTQAQMEALVSAVDEILGEVI